MAVTVFLKIDCEAMQALSSSLFGSAIDAFGSLQRLKHKEPFHHDDGRDLFSILTSVVLE